MLLLLAVLLFAVPSFAATRAGSVSALLPSAEIQRGATTTPALRGAAVEENDLLRTDDHGRLRVKLLDQSVLSLGVNSQLRVIRYNLNSRQTALELYGGKLRAQVAKLTRAGQQFELRTPTAVAGVIGTDFGVDASDPDLTRFICISGDVRITSADPGVSGVIVCHGGTTVSVRRGHPPEPPQPASSDQMEIWKSITEPDAPDAGDPYKNY